MRAVFLIDAKEDLAGIIARLQQIQQSSFQSGLIDFDEGSTEIIPHSNIETNGTGGHDENHEGKIPTYGKKRHYPPPPRAGNVRKPRDEDSH